MHLAAFDPALHLAAVTFEYNTNPQLPRALFGHANGFTKESFLPVLKRLRKDLLHSLVAYDVWNHGDSYALNSRALETTRLWGTESFLTLGLDTLAVTRELDMRLPWIGIGHSMSGVAMLYTELMRPGTFDAIVCIDATLTNDLAFKSRQGKVVEDVPIVQNALRRRSIWASRQEAKSALWSRGMFTTFTEEAMDNYIVCD
jgi:pimeloyl-ACP methyl ester carboxylesterase